MAEQPAAMQVSRPAKQSARTVGEAAAFLLAPNAELRALVVPQEPEPPAQAAPPAECEAICAHHRPVRLSWAPLLKRVLATT